MQLKLLRSACYAFLLTLLAISVTVNVHAQTTSVSDVNAPSHVMMADGASVTFTVTYSSGSSGYYLGIYIWDTDSSHYATGTVSQSSPYTCQTVTGYANAAVCGVETYGGSGSETVTFDLKFNTPMVYALSARSVFGDNTGNVLWESESKQDFSISVRNTLSLSIQAEYPVVVTVDGMTESPGPAFVDVYPGSHTISVPAMVNVDNGTRLRFDHWSDGSTSTTETVYLTDDASYTPIYVKQYKLSLASSQGNATGADWYNEGAIADFSVLSSVPMNGILGTLGGKYDFQGWYEEKTLVSSSSNSSLQMNDQHTLTANWTPNYTAPITIIGVAVIAVLGLSYYLIRKKPTKPKRRRTRRKKPEQDTEEEHSVPDEAKPTSEIEKALTVPDTATPTTETQQVEPTESIDKPSRTTMFCTQCGASIPRDSKFCKECGANTV